MRFAIVLTLLLAALGVPSWYYLMPATADVGSSFSAQYSLMMERQPHIVNQHVETLMGECLPQATRASQAAKRLAAETFSKSMLFMAEDKPSEEASQEMISWTIEKAERLSTTDQEDFLKLIRQTNNIKTSLCLMSGIKSSASFNFASKALLWELRL